MSDTFVTDDMYLTAFLVTLGYEIANARMTSNSRGRVLFTFDRTDELDQARRRFVQFEAVVEPRAYIQALATVRNRIDRARSEAS